MPLDNYGVWKAQPRRYDVERRGARTPHLTLYFRDNSGPDYRAAINIKSGDRDESRLVYWVNEDMSGHPLVDGLSRLQTGFHRLDDQEPEPGGPRLDYIRSNLFDVDTGRILEHDINGPNNDIIDVLEPRIQQAIAEGATVYIFGEQFNTGDGIHNIHMNQGNIPRYSGDDGVFQDGALIIHFPQSKKWVGIFLAFASQAVHTSEVDGHAISRVRWKGLLLDDLVENSVAIRRALVNTTEGQQFVTLANLTNRRVSLARWRIRNSEWAQQVLSRNSALNARATNDFSIPHCPLSQNGDTITLLDRDGLKVAGVRYNSQQGTQNGPIDFAGQG
ncbi:hypothetical protein ASPACDRAFT_47060 [Aspergillus aculeatus ATCC 16872]|uniref:LTD domain-containing protein n=1 Tax=Aspergillus aculeatus (strain ATCC 16872 / CBS 172.66 / WB 5094) TaxID=690307 RepID=A0A1L9WJF6_ASPA1|nr:uncharacterized protein ASPACDRAFT_47060 [Aspergillus aculeatus ATCC 16872]OJJ96289.1 hypothetical protein ASPACDRAFT_47060 [Aspergillus aculeatus ATCC 16872]